jgi:hypothetical protein
MPRRVDPKTRNAAVRLAKKIGRGGVDKAAKKYQVHALSVRKWLKEDAGAPEQGQIAASDQAQAAAPKAAPQKRIKAPALAGKKNQIIQKIEKIQQYEQQITELKLKIEEAKADMVKLISE